MAGTVRVLSVFPQKGAAQRRELAGQEQCEALGRRMAEALGRVNPGALLFFGPLGVGKTTLCRALVSALPGASEAEISSPSFTICNIYCTEPAVHHFDLYRLPAGMGDEALDESFDAWDVLTIVEWTEHLPESYFPADGLALRLSHGLEPAARIVEMSVLGPLGEQFLTLLV